MVGTNTCKKPNNHGDVVIDYRKVFIIVASFLASVSMVVLVRDVNPLGEGSACRLLLLDQLTYIRSGFAFLTK